MSIRPLTFIVVVFVLLVAACSPVDDTPALPDATAASTSAPATTASGAGDTSTTAQPPASTSSATPPTTREFNTNDLNLGAGSNFIPLDDPVMIPASAATWLDADDVVLGIVADDGSAQAFPIRQMAYHHIANTTVAGEPYLVTY